MFLNHFKKYWKLLIDLLSTSIKKYNLHFLIKTNLKIRIVVFLLLYRYNIVIQKLQNDVNNLV